jgi:kynureninase
MTQPLLEAALERGYTVRSPQDPAQRGGHVTIDPGTESVTAERVHEQLIARGFVVDHRPGVGIRVSPHFYNSLDEALACLDAMAEVLAGR